MFSKFFLAAILAIIVVACADAQIVENVGAPPAPTLDSIDAASTAASTAHCNAKQCKTSETIAQAMDVLLSAQATTMGATNPLPADRDKVSAERLNHILLDHPEEFAPVCGMLTELARQYPPGDLFVAVGSMQLALRMDLRETPSPPGACLPLVLKAFLSSAKADAAIKNAGILCVNAWHLGGACSRLHR
jgi:hypothetical protein